MLEKLLSMKTNSLPTGVSTPARPAGGFASQTPVQSLSKEAHAQTKAQKSFQLSQVDKNHYLN